MERRRSHIGSVFLFNFTKAMETGQGAWRVVALKNAMFFLVPKRFRRSARTRDEGVRTFSWDQESYRDPPAS